MHGACLSPGRTTLSTLVDPAGPTPAPPTTARPPSPCSETTVNPATITDLRRSWDGVYLLLARCSTCGKDVMHGGGSDPAAVASYLGHRVGHCNCAGYELVDAQGVIARRVAEIAAEPRRSPRRR